MINIWNTIIPKIIINRMIMKLKQCIANTNKKKIEL